MNKSMICVLVLFFPMIFYAQNKNIIGKWNTIHEETGKIISVVEIYEMNNKIYGKVCEISNPKSRNLLCKNCPGEDKDKPILGLTIIKGMTKKEDGYEGGEITDPNNGKTYRCMISFGGKDKLIVRGYLGISLFGRSQTWIRQK